MIVAIEMRAGESESGGVARRQRVGRRDIKYCDRDGIASGGGWVGGWSFLAKLCVVVTIVTGLIQGCAWVQL